MLAVGHGKLCVLPVGHGLEHFNRGREVSAKPLPQRRIVCGFVRANVRTLPRRLRRERIQSMEHRGSARYTDGHAIHKITPRDGPIHSKSAIFVGHDSFPYDLAPTTKTSRLRLRTTSCSPAARNPSSIAAS